MSTKMDALSPNHTIDLVPRQPHLNVVGCRSIYKNKFHTIGTHKHCKSRLVAKGYNQEFGRDNTEIFSPIIKTMTLRLALDAVLSNSIT